MSSGRVVAVVLVVLGILGLVYGGFTYTEERHDVDLGPVDIEVADKERVNVPVWLGVGAIAVGLLMLVSGRRR
jgi:hypothetical protein